MERNRFFKSTFGSGGEFLIANSLDASGPPVAGKGPTGATITVTQNVAPATADRINFFVGGEQYSYIVKATDTTATILVASILAYLNTNTQGFTATATGTTSAVYTLASTVPNASLNGVVVTATLGATNVSTFSALSFTSFGTNGADPADGGFQPTFELFITNAAAGSLAAYWDDNHEALLPASTSQYANAERRFFYVMKTQDSTPNVLCSTPIRASRRQYRTIAFSAGQADVWTLTCTGTYTAGQIIHVKIIDTTSLQIPYPNYEYIVVSTGVIATDLAALAVLINAETNDPVATATTPGNTNVLTLTGIYNSRQIKPGYFLETVGQPGLALGTDATTCVFAQTQASIAEVGTTADVLEFEKYFKIQNGVMIYTEAGMLPSEFSSIQQLTQVGIQYGFFVLTQLKLEYQQSSALSTERADKTFTVIAVPSTALATLAGL